VRQPSPGVVVGAGAVSEGAEVALGGAVAVGSELRAGGSEVAVADGWRSGLLDADAVGLLLVGARVARGREGAMLLRGCWVAAAALAGRA